MSNETATPATPGESCPVCYADDEHCACATWAEYWRNLTDAQRTNELRAMDRHATETDHL